MPRDDDFEDDDRPRRRGARDDEPDDRPARPRRRRDDDDFDRLRPPRKKSGVGLLIGVLVGVFVLCCGGVVGLGYWVFSAAKPAVEKAVTMAGEANEAEQSRQNLSRIANGLHNYNDVHGHLPQNSYEDVQRKPQGKANPTDRPLLSWRVHLLPYLDQELLYRRFKLDEPWDSPNNLPLLNRMPDVYATPEAAKRAGPGKTYYRGFGVRGALFETPQPPNPPARLRIPGSFPDGSANTIGVVEAAEAVEWTRPEAIDWPPGGPRPGVGGISPSLPFFQAAMMDGSVAKIRKDITDQTLRWLIDGRDGNVIAENWQFR